MLGTESPVVIIPAAELVIPFAPHVGNAPLETSVPSKVPSPPSDRAVVPLPAFCELRSDQQTILFQRPSDLIPLTKSEMILRESP